MKRFLQKQMSFVLTFVMLFSLTGVAEEGVDESYEINIDEATLLIGDEMLPEEIGSVDLSHDIILDDGPGAEDATGEPVTIEEESTVPDDSTKTADLEAFPSKLRLGKGETYDLGISNATFKTSKKSVASVSKKGVITAKKKGSATITVKSGGMIVGKCKVTVLSAPKKVSLSKSKLTIPASGSYTLKASLPKKTASNKLAWKSSDEAVAKVDGTGVVTGVKAGTARITVTTFNKKSATCTVTVNNDPATVSFETGSIAIGVKETVTVKPVVNEGAEAEFTWSTKDKKIATVSKKGRITGKKVGSTKLTVKTQNGLKATLTVKVMKAPGKVTLEQTEAMIYEGDTLKLTATLPKKTASQITWTSSDPEVATVSSDGVVTGLSEGETTITATTFNNKEATCTVSVFEGFDEGPLKGISLTETSATLYVGETMELYTILDPENTVHAFSEFSCSDPEVVALDTEGAFWGDGVIVTAMSPGIATITATNEGLSASCKVKVLDPALNDFVIENGVITKYTGPGGKVEIPSEDKDGNAVTAIGNSAFTDCVDLTSVTIPEGVTKIEDGVYRWEKTGDSTEYGVQWTNLKLVGYGAFSGCTNLTWVDMPQGVVHIGALAFSECSSLIGINLPSGLTSIGDCAFHNCSSLRDLFLPSSIESIGETAFAYCSSLTAIAIPEKITSLKWNVFGHCDSLSSVYLPNGIKIIGEQAFRGCEKLESVKLPDSVTTIEKYAFMGDTSLKEITIPPSVSSIGDKVFAGCENLTVKVYPNTYAQQWCKDNDVKYAVYSFVDSKYKGWGKSEGTIKPVEFAILSAICSEVSGQTSVGKMKDAFYNALKTNFPLGHPLHADDDPTKCAIGKDHFIACREGTDKAMEAIVIRIDSSNAIVVFAGTKSMADGLQDFLIGVDSNFFSMPVTVAIDLLKTINPIEWLNENQPEAANRVIKNLSSQGYSSIYVAGWSLGGHLAVDVTLNNDAVKECYAFDPPGRGDTWYRKYVSAEQATRIVNYLCVDSFVSSIGEHIGTNIELNVVPNDSAPPFHNHGIEEIIDALGGRNSV